MLSVERLRGGYAGSQILFDVAFTALAGECVAILGRNGVGKTTTLRALSGLLPGATGRAEWQGASLLGLAPHHVVRLGLVLVPEDRRIFRDLTVFENLIVPTAGDAAAAKRAFERTLALFPELADHLGRRGGLLSGGQQQMLAIGRALSANPSLLLLDEPSEGLAPLVVERLRDAVLRLKAEGLAILLAEQNLDFSLGVADRVVVLERGRVRHTGDAAALRVDHTLQASLLAV